jgi:hypothetical protein
LRKAPCYAAALPGLASLAPAVSDGAPGTRIFVPQLRQRTVLPRQVWGTAKTLRQVRLGHMMRTLGEFAFDMGPRRSLSGIFGV